VIFHRRMPSDSEQLERAPEADSRRIVRECLPSDSSAIKRILSEANLSSLETSDLRDAVSNQIASYHTQVCEVGKEVVAALQWRQVGQEVEIFDVAVDATHRRQGIASILLESVLGLARERGAKEFFMEVRESNAAALALYRTLGFSVTGRRPNYYRDPDDAALLLRLDVTV